MRKRFTTATAMAVLVLASSGVYAETRGVPPKRHHRGAVLRADPSEDAVMLSILAPPSPSSTRRQSYGDAVFARARQQRRTANAQLDPRGVPFGIYPCEPREAGAAGYACDGDPARPGYGQYYAYLPANASAPQVPRGDPGAQSRVLAPATALFWAVNSLRFDPHN